MRLTPSGSRVFRILVAVIGLSPVVLLSASPVPAQAAVNVLRVGTYNSIPGPYTTIQAAVNAAHPGDWILVGPGVYHEKGFSPTLCSTTDCKPRPSEVFITTAGLHLRGMNRDSVIVDGTNVSTTQAAGTLPPGSPACSSDPALQDPGVKESDNNVYRREGIQVFQADGVHIENLTSCNSMDNEIWWNNGDGSGLQGPMAVYGDYITATSTFYKDANSPSAQYGIFTSNVEGPALIDHSYANNMTDSSYYVGACRNCNTVLNHAHAENSALGLSSTNAGGNLLIENGEWDLNRTGLVSNAQNNDDWPSPEYGQCVSPSTPPSGAGPDSCYVIRNNKIHDNNNPNTPGSGLTAVSAVGAGVELAATQHISVISNQIYNQDSWGVVTHDFPDPENGPAQCEGGVWENNSGVCVWFSRGNYVANNTFTNNGGFGNTTNGDIANQASGALDASGCPRGNGQGTNPPCVPSATNPDPNCFKSNTLSVPSPPALESEWPRPGTGTPPTGLQETPCPPSAFESTVLTAQLVCATGAASLFTQGQGSPACPTGASYPQHNATADTCKSPSVPTPANADPSVAVCFLPLSYTLSAAVSPTMPDPCAGVPANPWCPAVGTGVPEVPIVALPVAVGGIAAALWLAAPTTRSRAQNAIRRRRPSLS
jgi:hypothetical protein